jgi:acyl carrier protein
MTHWEFLTQMDEILGLPAGTIRGDEKLEDLENWDSTALISFVALAEAHSDANVSPDQIVTCSTVADLLSLAQVDSAGVPA